MKRTLIITLACTLGLMLSGVTAQALPLPLTYGDAYYLGNFTPNTPSSPGDEENYINALNDLLAGVGPVAGSYGLTYSRVGSTLAGPFPAAVYGMKDESEGVESIDATGYSYVVGKYGGGAAAGYSLVWFLASGFTGEVAPQASYDGNGLSHISVFTRATTVPDGGMTLMLLGGALVGIGALRRRFRA